MEHIIQEHTLERPEAHKGEVVLHCMACGDWVSLSDHIEVIKEFQDSPCPGQRQHEDDDCILGELEPSPPFCRHKWDDNIMRKHRLHECYLDEGHDGDHVCGDCVEGYDQLDDRPPLHPKDDGGPVFKSPFYAHPDFSKED